jgi:hypothetical protein
MDYAILHTSGEIIEKNNLVSPVICSTTSPNGVEIIYKYKLLIEINIVKKNKLNDWQVMKSP